MIAIYVVVGLLILCGIAFRVCLWIAADNMKQPGWPKPPM